MNYFILFGALLAVSPAAFTFPGNPSLSSTVKKEDPISSEEEAKKYKEAIESFAPIAAEVGECASSAEKALAGLAKFNKLCEEIALSKMEKADPTCFTETLGFMNVLENLEKEHESQKPDGQKILEDFDELDEVKAKNTKKYRTSLLELVCNVGARHNFLTASGHHLPSSVAQKIEARFLQQTEENLQKVQAISEERKELETDKAADLKERTWDFFTAQRAHSQDPLAEVIEVLREELKKRIDPYIDGITQEELKDREARDKILSTLSSNQDPDQDKIPSTLPSNKDQE